MRMLSRRRLIDLMLLLHTMVVLVARAASVSPAERITWQSGVPPQNPFLPPPPLLWYSAMSGFSQDWSPVVFSKKKPTAGTSVKDVDAVRLCRVHLQPALRAWPLTRGPAH